MTRHRMQQIGVLNLHVQLDKHPARRDGAIVLWNPVTDTSSTFNRQDR